MNRHLYRHIVLSVVIVALVVGLGGCKGKRLISRDEEIRVGHEAGDKFEAQYGRETNSQVNTKINQIGANIAPAAQPPNYPYEYRVLADEQVNAVAFPGGRIYVFRGLVEALGGNPDKLAWVIAHETAHVARQHAVRRMERQLGQDIIIDLLLGDKKDAAKVAGIISGLVLLDYGRDNEYEADRVGMVYAHQAGYDPTAAVAVLEEFQEIQRREPNDFEIMFATHPGNNDRINHAKAYLQKMGWSGSYHSPEAEFD